MTRNQQILLIMTWMISYFSITPETAEDIASSVLDELGGDIEEVAPAEVMNAAMREYFRRSENGEAVSEQIPGWSEFGFVRPSSPLGKDAILGDDTFISSQYLGIVLSDQSVSPDIEDDYHGVAPDGSLILKSGGTVPPLSDSDREKVWVAVFCDPSAIDQEKIDELVADPPAIPENGSFVEQSAIDAYQHVIENAQFTADAINSGKSTLL
jgi:hypothetical protein